MAVPAAVVVARRVLVHYVHGTLNRDPSPEHRRLRRRPRGPESGSRTRARRSGCRCTITGTTSICRRRTASCSSTPSPHRVNTSTIACLLITRPIRAHRILVGPATADVATRLRDFHPQPRVLVRRQLLARLQLQGVPLLHRDGLHDPVLADDLARELLLRIVAHLVDAVVRRVRERGSENVGRRRRRGLRFLVGEVELRHRQVLLLSGPVQLGVQRLCLHGRRIGKVPDHRVKDRFEGQGSQARRGEGRLRVLNDGRRGNLELLRRHRLRGSVCVGSNSREAYFPRRRHFVTAVQVRLALAGFRGKLNRDCVCVSSSLYFNTDERSKASSLVE
mmetsp:Transcript_12811/g.31189  ORF Transcript_12811/g.31189 Transcript_12811/m.31189 type:complete len:334 (+) Transcript_12811:1281-2282(+)